MVNMVIISRACIYSYPNNSKISDIQDYVGGDIDRWENDGGRVLDTLHVQTRYYTSDETF